MDVAAVRFSVPPTHTGLLLPAVGVAGVPPALVTVTVLVMAQFNALVSVTVYVPAGKLFTVLAPVAPLVVDTTVPDELVHE